MSKKILPIIQASELYELLNQDDLIIVDVSYGKDARLNYDNKHIHGALFVDLNTQLANINADFSIGGRHPLPTLEQFSKALTHLGISKKSHVIIYDDKNGASAAARFWWMLKSVGHKKVQVLNGGLQAAERIGLPIDSKMVKPKVSRVYKIENWNLPLSDMEEVERVSQDDSFKVIDVRDVERYNGEKEPIDLIAGHIPGALNVPFSENLDDFGLFLAPKELNKKYKKIFKNTKPENVIIHCGSGVTVCHTLLALAYAGIEIPKLYVGSWSELSRNNKTIATSKAGS